MNRCDVSSLPTSANWGTGDLGWSIARPAPVRDQILDRLPWTLALLLIAVVISTIVGTAAGVAAGWAPGEAATGS